MASTSNSDHYYICDFCTNPVLAPKDFNATIHCGRCGHKNHRLKPRSPRLSMIFTLTALIFYIPANILPFMTIEFYGAVNKSNIWNGVVSLAEGGSWLIAIIVFLASMLIPFLKLIILFYLGLSSKAKRLPEFKTKLYHFVEIIGRWSMLDIFLLAVLVSIMKLGRWTTVTAEPGAIMFLLVVIFTMLASAFFDPKLLWKDKNDNN